MELYYILSMNVLNTLKNFTATITNHFLWNVGKVIIETSTSVFLVWIKGNMGHNEKVDALTKEGVYFGAFLCPEIILLTLLIFF